MEPTAIIDCQVNGTFYEKGDKIKVDNAEQYNKLIELGFIGPRTQKEITNYFKENKKEVKKWD